jgi:60S ribosome subunit biogenesis protein NIP7
MRLLTEEETKVVFEKLANYIGRNISFLIDNPTNPHVFRLQKDRVYYVSEQVANFATSVSKPTTIPTTVVPPCVCDETVDRGRN